MKVGTKLSLALALPILLVLAAFAYLDERWSRRRLDETLSREGWAITRAAQVALEDAVRSRHSEEAQSLVDELTGHASVIGLRLFHADGSLAYQSPTLDRHDFLFEAELGTVLRDRQQLRRIRLLDGKAADIYLVPLSSPDGNLLGAFQLIHDGSILEDEARASRHALTILTIAVVGAIGGILFLVTRVVVTRPIEALVRSMREVATGDFRARAPTRGEDEFARLSVEFNAMCARLEETRRALAAEQERRLSVQQQLRIAERLAALGRLSAGLAHEVGTPLGVIRGRAESLLTREAGWEAAQRNLSIIIGQIDRIGRTVRGMLDFARVGGAGHSPTDLAGVLRDVLELIAYRCEQKGITLSKSLPGGLPPIAADADRLQEVFLNLALNAIDAMPEGGELDVGVRCETRAHAEGGGPALPYLAATLSDTGVGVAPENLGRIFEPFFTTKDVGQGSGLGLSIAYGIVRAHGGWIDLASVSGQGTTATVYLPLVGSLLPAAVPGESAA